MLIKASAPGSLMLLGEYAVLYGKQALVCAVDKRMTVTLKPRNDHQVTIQSALGNLEISLKKIEVIAPFKFVLAALKKFQNQLPSGCDIHIEAEFSDQMGFASSAAVTVATLAALNAWLNLSLTNIKLAQLARNIVRSVQGLGSGADVAACVFGGVVGYRSEPFCVQEEKIVFPLTVVYSGYKTPTVDAIQYVKKKFEEEPKIFQHLCQAIHQCGVSGLSALQKKEFSKLGNIMNIQQGLLEALGVSTVFLQEIIAVLRQQKTILGAKISGSGLGDCIVAIGKIDEALVLPEGATQIPVEIAKQGVMCEKN